MGSQLYNRGRHAMAVAVRRIVDPDRAGPPRIVVLLVGNGAKETTLHGRPPSTHLALVRALEEVPNVAVVRVHEAGTTMVRCPRCRRLGTRPSTLGLTAQANGWLTGSGGRGAHGSLDTVHCQFTVRGRQPIAGTGLAISGPTPRARAPHLGGDRHRLQPRRHEWWVGVTMHAACARSAT